MMFMSIISLNTGNHHNKKTGAIHFIVLAVRLSYLDYVGCYYRVSMVTAAFFLEIKKRPPWWQPL